MIQPESPENLTFFLGGHDLEMATIRGLLEQHAPGRFHDKNLAWGARASAYPGEIRAAIALGRTPVLVELPNDLDPSEDAASVASRPPVIVVDHHGPAAGKDRPTSLHQVFKLLKLDPALWTRWFDLVAANDRGYIPAMREIGATRDEITRVRCADRAVQGITPEQEAQGEQALHNAQVLAGGRLTLVGLPHDRTAVIADRLALERADSYAESLLILGRDSVHFFGDGRLVLELDGAFPGGWFGGALPDRGFWGHAAPAQHTLAFLLDRIQSSQLGE